MRKAFASNDIRWETTVAGKHAHNVQVRDGITEDEFASMRTARDATLGMPKLILPAIQINMHGGRLAEPDAQHRHFLKIPLNAL